MLTFPFIFGWRTVTAADVLPGDSGFIHLCEDSWDPSCLLLLPPAPAPRRCSLIKPLHVYLWIHLRRCVNEAFVPAWLSPWRPDSVANHVHEDRVRTRGPQTTAFPVIRTLIITTNFFACETAVTFSALTWRQLVGGTVPAWNSISTARRCRKRSEMTRKMFPPPYQTWQTLALSR